MIAIFLSSHVYAQIPPNDDCSGAVVLVSSTSCASISGTLYKATPSLSIPPSPCGNLNSPDVWYSFIAKSAYPTITLSSVVNFTPVIQLISGTCGSQTQLACASGLSLNVNTAYSPGLIIGNTYYVRITTSNRTGTGASGTTFNICVTDLQIDFSKAYISVTDGTVGGTINPGDILEIRSTFVVTGTGKVDNLSYYDTLKANGGFRYQTASLATRTNEGKIFTAFTDPVDADAGGYTTGGAGFDTTIRINIGTGATASNGGTLLNSSIPSFYGGTCIIIATYRVAVTAAYNTKIKFGGGAFKFSVSGVPYIITFPNDSLVVYPNLVSCSDGVAPANLIGSASNGTFGSLPLGSMPTNALQNGGPAAINTTYGYTTFAGGNGPNDYYYGVANNTSSTNNINQNLGKPGGSARVFGVWDITGDHTGALDQNKGNSPCDVSKPVSATNPCGYLLAVNAAYRSDKAFEYTVNGSCTETYYEVSAWFKNLCYKCGCDVNGKGSGDNSGPPYYIPTASGDSSGVRPNIAMQIDGIDYYTTGELVYQGLGGTQSGSDTLNNWVRRAFVFKTSTTQTSFKITFKNLAPGGGGNDWAIDDIGLRTCYPTSLYAPPNPIVYIGDTLRLTDTVRSYYNNYNFYKWQRKPALPAASPWADIPGFSGVATPTLNPVYNQWEYTQSYTIPGTMTLAVNAGDLYRMVVASNLINLTGGCSSPDSTTYSLLPTNAFCKSADTNFAIAPQTGYINWNKLNWSKGHVPTCCESAHITYTSSNASTDMSTVNITNDICIINLTLVNKSTTSNQIFKTILYPGYNMQMNGNVRMSASSGTNTDSCVFIAQGGGTITVNGNTVIGYPADNAYCIFGTAPGTNMYAKYRLRGDSLTFNNRAITNPNYTSITIDPLAPATPVKITNNTGNYIPNQLSFDSLRIGTISNPTTAILLGSNPVAYTNNNIGGIDVKDYSVFDMQTNAINAGGTFKSSFYLRPNSLLKLGGSSNGVTGSNFPANYPTYNFDPTSTVIFNGAAQTIPGTANNVNAYGNITLTGTGVKTGSISNVNLAGNLYRTNTGHTYNANSGRVTFTSSINAQRYYTDAGATPIDFYDFTNNNTYTTGLSIDSTMGVLDELELKTGTKITLNTGDIIMRSAASRTSHITNLGTTIPSIIYNGAYRFVVERYLPGQKSWRFLATPVQLLTNDAGTPTIAAAWREGNASVTSTGYGTQITGPTGPTTAAAGSELDFKTQRGSMKYYNDLANGWTELSNTTTTKIANTQGYMIFVRGDRGASNTVSGAGTITNLRIKGQIRTGDQLYNVLANKFQSIGNPYASQINFGSITKSSIANAFFVWKPSLSGLYGVGGYENYVFNAGDYWLNGIINGTKRNTIESGEAFFVQNMTASAGSVIVKETDKGILSNIVSRTANNNGMVVPTINISFFEKDASESFILVDGVSTSFDNSFSSGLDNDDVIKFTNTNDNLFIKSNNKNLVVERRPIPNESDTIKLGITGTRVAAYRFIIDPYLLENTNLDAFLVDKYLQTETALSLLDSNTVNFNITSVATSSSADRFMIVFKPLKATVINNILAVRNEDKTATVKWEIKEERNIDKYTIEQSNDGINFKSIGTQAPLANDGTNMTYTKIDVTATKAKNWYRIKATNKAGSIIYSDDAVVNEIIESVISVYPNPVMGGKINLYLKYQPTGTYTVQISNKTGQVLKTEALKISNNNEIRIINLGAAAEGTYQIKITGSTGIKTTLSIMVK